MKKGVALSSAMMNLTLAVAEATDGRLHVAGLCNRNLTAFAAELPALLPEAEAVGA
jgi:cytochrome c biogenesis protein